MKKILFNGNSPIKRSTTAFIASTPKDADKDAPLVEVIYPEKYFSDLDISAIEKALVLGQE